jgi:predicted small secreted protein
MRKIIRLSPVLALIALAACQTVEGAGRDLQTAGQVVENESRDVQAGL